MAGPSSARSPSASTATSSACATLYLAAFAASFAAAPGLWRARLTLDGVSETVALYNLVVSNVPVYAGPLRFDGENDSADGRLDVHALATGRDYLTEYPAAWIRYLRALHGAATQPSALLRRAREIVLELERDVPALVDGEELPPARAFRLGVLPRAVRVCTAPLSAPAGSARSR
jgi:diacylglycerol kinase family enzyme